MAYPSIHYPAGIGNKAKHMTINGINGVTCGYTHISISTHPSSIPLSPRSTVTLARPCFLPWPPDGRTEYTLPGWLWEV